MFAGGARETRGGCRLSHKGGRPQPDPAGLAELPGGFPAVRKSKPLLELGTVRLCGLGQNQAWLACTGRGLPCLACVRGVRCSACSAYRALLGMLRSACSCRCALLGVLAGSVKKHVPSGVLWYTCSVAHAWIMMMAADDGRWKQRVVMKWKECARLVGCLPALMHMPPLRFVHAPK